MDEVRSKIIKKYWQIDEVNNENIREMLARPPSYYKKRLLKIGFQGRDTNLLDAGCGAGYWAVCASSLNKKVSGIDLTKNYLKYAEKIKNNFNVKNVDLKPGNIEKLPYKNNSFDFILCYSVWMFVDKNRSLKEFYRVLKPGGKLYLGSITGPAWYPNLILKGIMQGNRNLIFLSIKAIVKKIPLRSKMTCKILKENNFRVLEINSDGKVGDPKIKIAPIYLGKSFGFWNIYEILAEKK